jgi:hypothetical protein
MWSGTFRLEALNAGLWYHASGLCFRSRALRVGFRGYSARLSFDTGHTILTCFNPKVV